MHRGAPNGQLKGGNFGYTKGGYMTLISTGSHFGDVGLAIKAFGKTEKEDMRWRGRNRRKVWRKRKNIRFERGFT